MTALDVGTNLLAAVVAALGEGAPARQLFAVGAPTDPLEGEQVAVGFSRFFTGDPGAPRGGPESICNGPLVAEFVVRLLRCFPTSTTQADTPVDAVLATTAVVLADAEAIRLALRSWNPYAEPRAAELGDVWVGDVIGYRPQGMGQGLSTTVHVAT